MLNMGAEWYDFDMECDVKDAAREQIYDGRPERIQTLMWRYLALRAIVADDKRVLDAVVEHYYDGEEFDGERLYLVFFIDGEPDDDVFPFHDEWYVDDEDMQEAVDIFKTMLNID